MIVQSVDNEMIENRYEPTLVEALNGKPVEEVSTLTHECRLPICVFRMSA